MTPFGDLKKIIASISLLLWMAFPQFGSLASANVEACSRIVSGEARIVEIPAKTRIGEATSLKGILMKPQGEGSFPALVILHRSFGIEDPRCYQSEQNYLKGMGYVSLLVDSDSIKDPARKGFYSTGGYSYIDQGRDAYAAKAFLVRLPFIIPEKIGLLGYARGGGAALRAAYSPLALRSENDGAFTAVIAFHPFCAEDLINLEVPLLIINGQNDLMNPPELCRLLHQRTKTDKEFTLITLPKAGHNFNVAWLPTYDNEATKYAYVRVRNFLKTHLR